MDVHTQATRAASLPPTWNAELRFAPVKLKKKRKKKKVRPLAQACYGGGFGLVLVLLPVSEQGRYLHHQGGRGGSH